MCIVYVFICWLARDKLLRSNTNTQPVTDCAGPRGREGGDKWSINFELSSPLQADLQVLVLLLHSFVRFNIENKMMIYSFYIELQETI